MEAKRFDTLTKAWIDVPRRRLGGLIVGALWEEARRGWCPRGERAM